MAKASGPQRPRRRFGRVRKLPSGHYQAGYLAPDGSMIYADRTFPTKAMADRFLVLTEAEMLSGTWTAPERRRETVGEWAERWLTQGRSQGQWRATTANRYGNVVKTHVNTRWGSTPLGDVTREDVREWATEMREAGSALGTVRYAVGTLSRILQLAVDAGIILTNPCDRVRVGTPRPPEVRPLTVEDVEALATEIEQPELKTAGNGARPVGLPVRSDLALWVRLAAYCGLRAGEVAALRWGRINLDAKVLRVEESLSESAGNLVFGHPKGNRPRAVPIPDPLIPDLRDHLGKHVGPADDDLVFTTESGGPIWHSDLYPRHFKPAVKRAGLSPDLRYHDLRHTYAALLIAEGAHPRSIMERMGHSSITVTLGTYGHLFPSLEAELTDRLSRAISRGRSKASCTGVARPGAPKSKPPKK